MTQRVSFAVLFIFITLGAAAKTFMPLKPAADSAGGFHRHSGIADTAETPDEHVREEVHKHPAATS